MKTRLALARAGFWLGWAIISLTLALFTRRDHPTRIYVEGARQQVLAPHLEALKYGTGPRFSRVFRWKMISGIVAGVAMVAPETRVATSLITLIGAAV